MSNERSSVNQALTRANFFAKKGQFNQAMQLYDEILRKFPGNKRAIEGLKSLRRSGANQQQAAQARVPTQAQVDGLIALYRRGQLAKALEVGTALTKRYPKVPLLANILGAVNADMGRLDEAVAIYSKAIRLKPDYAEAHNNLGNALNAQGKKDAAIASYTKALQLKPDYAEAHNNLGNVLNDEGHHEEAIANYSKALELRRDYALAHNGLGNALEALGKQDEAIASYLKALQFRPDYAEAHNNLGHVFNDQGRHDEALACLTKALELRPDYAEAHNNLGIVLASKGNHDEAIASFSKALCFKPDYAGAHHNLGHAFNEQGRHDEALACLTRATELRPDYAEAHCSLGIVLASLGDYDAAVASYSKALEFKPDYAAAHNGLGIAFGSLGKYDEAIASYAKALEYDPDCEKAHNNLGNVLLAVGKHNEAFASYARALEFNPHDAVAHKNLCAVKKYKKGDPQVAQMLEIIADPAISRSDKMQLSFALGKAYDDMGDAESSFQHLMEGNRLRKQELGYDIGSDRREFGRIKSIFETGDLPTLDTNQPVTEWAKRPIFIIGMLRSGTTLTEQILASHSQVYGGGELGTLTEVVLPILNAAQESSGFELESRQIKAVRDGYLAELNGLGAEERFVTDKMPLNFRWVGFILTAIPEAKIIKLQRDPVATCWSIYKHYFSKDGNGYAYDLEDVAEYYKMYCDLMNYWRCIFPRQIYDLNYESLTENPEEEVRKLLEYCGLDWEDRCLEFHKNKRAVRTASSLQVRQEMYKGSSMAWRKYEKQLQPLLAALRG